MKRCTEQAYAKLNLTLDVLSKRADGYHEMDMLMQSVSLCDTVELALLPQAGLQLTIVGNEALAAESDNLALGAARALLEALGREEQGLAIRLHKRIPTQAGMAGGSSDAAAVLRGLNRLLDAALPFEALCALGRRLGADVPFCLRGGTQRAEGIGERLTPLLGLPPCHFVLCKPHFSVSTPQLFGRIDDCSPKTRPDTLGQCAALAAGDLPRLGRGLCNVFTEALPPQERAVVEALCAQMLRAGALGACMTGSGSTVFGLFAEEGAARLACEQLRARYPESFLCRPQPALKI